MKGTVAEASRNWVRHAGKAFLVDMSIHVVPYETIEKVARGSTVCFQPNDRLSSPIAMHLLRSDRLYEGPSEYRDLAAATKSGLFEKAPLVLPDAAPREGWRTL